MMFGGKILEATAVLSKRRCFKERIKDIPDFCMSFKHGIKYRIRRQLWDLDGHLLHDLLTYKNTVWV